MYADDTIMYRTISDCERYLELHNFLFFFGMFYQFSCIAVLPHSPGVVYYHLLLRQETRIPGVAPLELFSNRNLGSFCA